MTTMNTTTVKGETEVLVVGAGPTGLALAYQLRRLGVDCTLVEQHAGPSTTSKALGLQYRASEVLAWMGLAERFIARAETGTRVTFHAEGRALFDLRLGLAAEMSDREAFAPRALVLPQSETEAILLAALRERGGEVAWSTTFLGFTQDAAGVRARLRLADGTETEVAARYLVSCEGAHSAIRKLAGIEFAGTTYPLDFAMADVRCVWRYSHGSGHVWFHGDGIVAAMAMPGRDRWRFFIDITGAARPDGEVDLELVRRLMVERTGERAAVIDEPTWLTRFKISCRMVDRYRVGRVFLAGDAAHIHSPAGGQGITTGIQDAYNLAWKLGLVLRGGASEALLETYEEERLPIAREVLRTTDRNTKAVWTHGGPRQWLRDHVVLPLLSTTWVQRRMVRKLTQLDMHYRGRRLSVDAGRVGRLRAGDRAPDVVLVDPADGGRSTLFSHLQAGRFVALAFGTGDDAGLEEVLRRRGVTLVRAALGRAELTRLYAPRPGSLLLVRPDGYLGYVGPADARRVAAYLDALWGAAEQPARDAWPAEARAAG